MQKESKINKSLIQELSIQESIINEISKALIQWYPFSKNTKALFLSEGEEIYEGLPEAAEEWGVQVDSVPFTIIGSSLLALSDENPERVHPLSSQFVFSTAASVHPSYDYIILAGALERTPNPSTFLQSLRPLLSPSGRLLIGADNRLGVRYFCGDRDSFSGRNYDGIENYIHLSEFDWKRVKGRAYSKSELTQMLEYAGFPHHRFYSVFPEWTRPQALYAEDCAPEGKPEEQAIPQYNSPDTIFLEEERLYRTLIENNLFHTMSNGFLIECPLDGTFANASQITLSPECGREEALATIIRRDGQVEKRPLYREGRKKLVRLMENTLELRHRGLHLAEVSYSPEIPDVSEVPCGSKASDDQDVSCSTEVPGNQNLSHTLEISNPLETSNSPVPSLLTPHLSGELATEYFRRLICQDKELFFQELDRFFAEINRSSDLVPYEEIDWEHFDPDWKKGRADDPGRDKWRKIAFGSEKERENLGIIFKKGYVNLTSQNCFHIDGKFVFYNQGYWVENFPANGILIQTIDQIYWGDVWKDALLTKDELLEHYHLLEYEKLWHLYIWRFLEKLRHEKELRDYYQERRRDWRIVNANRARMNYSDNEYERVFKDIFRGTSGRQLYLFGSGIYAEKFLEEFGKDYPVTGILDNNREKWGMQMENIPISSPEILLSLPEDSYKVLICIKNCVPIMNQLKELGIHHYSVYDCRQEYPRKLPEVAAAVKEEGQAPKKYHIGYIAGVFDLFHIGHLNMFRRAKEQCDYLIVGVVTDESVMNNKKTMPYMSFEERMELVRSCRYVDEAVEIPTDNGDTDEAYRRYHFDAQFSGSDYENDPVWLAKKAYLEKRGSTMVFFPYTQATSSSKLKELITKKLL